MFLQLVHETKGMCHLDNNRYALSTNTRAMTQQHWNKFESPAAAPTLKCGAPSVRSRNSAVSAASCSGFLPRRTSREWICAFSLKLKEIF